MKRKITIIITMLAFLMLLCVGFTGQASALTTLPDPTSFLDSPTNLVPAALPYGDFYSYSLPVLQYFYGKDYSVKSTPGAIKGGIVIYTGASGTGLNENFFGMDDAYLTPSGVYTSFSTVTAADPGGDGEFSGDMSGTWDTTLSALDAYLDDGLYFFFNHNEKGGDEQSLLGWGLITLVDTDKTNLPDKYFELNNDTSGPGSYSSDGSFSTYEYAYVFGEFDLYGGNGSVMINHNLGANEVAFVLYSPELNAALSQGDYGGYDVMQIDFQLAELSNGFEQLFILNLVETTPIPEPTTMLLLGSGLIGLGAFGRKKFKKFKRLDV